MINQFSEFGEHEQKVAQALWNQLDDRGFPKSTGFYVWVWEEMPYSKDFDFNEIYSEYLREPKFERSVNNGMISRGNLIDQHIDEYIQLFRRVSIFTRQKGSYIDMALTTQDFVNITKYIYDYLDNEKSILTTKLDIFGNKEEGEQRFTKLGNFLAVLSAQAYYSNQYTDELKVTIDECINLLKEHNISTISLDLMDKFLNEELTEKYIEELVGKITFGSREEISQIMNAVDILLMLENESLIKVTVTETLLDFIKSLKYFDTPRNTVVIYQLTYVINHPLLIQENNNHIVIKAFEEYLSKLDLSLKNSSRDLIESIYSFSILVRRYYDGMIQNEINVPEKLLVIINKLSQTKLKEVRYMWEDI